MTALCLEAKNIPVKNFDKFQVVGRLAGFVFDYTEYTQKNVE